MFYVFSVVDVKWVADLTYPSGSCVDPGFTLTKTWIVKNTGYVAWTPDTTKVCSSSGGGSGSGSSNTGLMARKAVLAQNFIKQNGLDWGPKFPGLGLAHPKSTLCHNNFTP